MQSENLIEVTFRDNEESGYNENDKDFPQEVITVTKTFSLKICLEILNNIEAQRLKYWKLIQIRMENGNFSICR